MIEYYVKRISHLRFTVAKFDGGKAPADVYDVSFSSDTDTGRCSCFGFRHTGMADKHIQMVRDWLFAGQLVPDAFLETCPRQQSKCLVPNKLDYCDCWNGTEPKQKRNRSRKAFTKFVNSRRDNIIRRVR